MGNGLTKETGGRGTIKRILEKSKSHGIMLWTPLVWVGNEEERKREVSNERGIYRC